MSMVNYGWMLDAILVIAVLAFACARAVKGIYQVLMPLAVIAVSALGATFLSAVLTAPVTEAVYPIVEEKVISRIDMDALPTEKLDDWTLKLQDVGALAKEAEELIPNEYLAAAKKLGLDLSEFLTEAVGLAEERVTERVEDADIDLRDYLSEEQIQKLKDAGVETADTVVASTKTALASTADAVKAEGVIFSAMFSLTRRLTSVAVHYALWMLTCVGLLAALTIIKNTFGLVFKLPVIGWVDKGGGALVGAAECLIIVFVIGWVTRFLGFPILQQLATETKLLKLIVG